MATLTKGHTFASGDTVTATKLNDLVDSATIAAIQTADISDNQITTAKIVDANVTDAKLATGAVTGAAGGGKLAASAITSQTAIDALASDDTLLIHDDSNTALRKVTWSQIVAAAQPVGSVLQTVQSSVSDLIVITGTIPSDDTIPQQTEGGEITTASITPSSASNKILIRAVVNGTAAGGTYGTAALFAGSASSAIAAWLGLYSGYDNQICIEYLHSPNTTSAITYKLRAGADSGNFHVNAYSNAARRYGGVARTTLTLQEIKG